MRKILYAIPLILALSWKIAPGAAPGAAAPANFLAPDAVDLAAVLAPPAATDSPATQAELAEIRGVQAAATQAEKTEAVADAQESVFLFAGVLGPNFTAEKLPVATPFFQKTGKAEGEFVNPAKALFNRPRPPVVDPAVAPCEKLTGSASYPSGHATFSYLEAVILSKMIPEKREAIFARAAELAHDRVVCGVHYPSDLEAGRISGAVIASALLADPAFALAFAPAKAELRAVLGLPGP